MPPLSDRQGVMRLIRIATYLARYTPGFTDVTSLIRELLKKENYFRWDDTTHGAAFDKLKSMLSTAPVLRYYEVTSQWSFSATHLRREWALAFCRTDNQWNILRALWRRQSNLGHRFRKNYMQYCLQWRNFIVMCTTDAMWWSKRIINRYSPLWRKR